MRRLSIALLLLSLLAVGSDSSVQDCLKKCIGDGGKVLDCARSCQSGNASGESPAPAEESPTPSARALGIASAQQRNTVGGARTAAREASQPGRGVGGTGGQNEDPSLASVLEAYSERRRIVVSFCNNGFLDLALNWRASLKRVEVPNFLMVVFDERAYETLNQSGDDMHTFLYHHDHVKGIATKALIHGSVEYQRLVLLKTAFVQEVLKLGYDVLVNDADIVWLQNSFELIDMDGGEQYDMQFQSDAAYKTSQDIFENFVNSGFMFIRASERTRSFFKQVWKMQSETMELMDQPCVNMVLRKSKGIKFRLFDPALVANGFVYFTRRLPQRQGVTPYAIHNNYVYGKDAKIKRFQLHGLWFIPDPNFDEDALYVSYGHPDGMVNVAQEIDAIRFAAMAAAMTNRTLALPAIRCAVDSPTAECSADLIIDLHDLLQEFPTAVFQVMLPVNGAYDRFVNVPLPEWGDEAVGGEVMEALERAGDQRRVAFVGKFPKSVTFPGKSQGRRVLQKVANAVGSTRVVRESTTEIAREIRPFVCLHISPRVNRDGYRQLQALVTELLEAVKRIKPRVIYLALPPQMVKMKFVETLKSKVGGIAVLGEIAIEPLTYHEGEPVEQLLHLADANLCAESDHFIGDPASEFSRYIMALRAKRATDPVKDRQQVTLSAFVDMIDNQ